MCYSRAASVKEGGGIISPVTAQRSNISTFYHKTPSESQLGRSVTSQVLTAALSSVTEHIVQAKAACHKPSVMLTLIRLT